MAVKFLLTVVFTLVCLVFVLTSSATINFPGHVSLRMCARIAGYRFYIFNLIRCREAVHHTVRVFVCVNSGLDSVITSLTLSSNL